MLNLYAQPTKQAFYDEMADNVFPQGLLEA
jgi:hypothetical protein